MVQSYLFCPALLREAEPWGLHCCHALPSNVWLCLPSDRQQWEAAGERSGSSLIPSLLEPDGSGTGYTCLIWFLLSADPCSTAPMLRGLCYHSPSLRFMLLLVPGWLNNSHGFLWLLSNGSFKWPSVSHLICIKSVNEQLVHYMV